MLLRNIQKGKKLLKSIFIFYNHLVKWRRWQR